MRRAYSESALDAKRQQKPGRVQRFAVRTHSSLADALQAARAERDALLSGDIGPGDRFCLSTSTADRPSRSDTHVASTTKACGSLSLWRHAARVRGRQADKRDLLPIEVGTARSSVADAWNGNVWEANTRQTRRAVKRAALAELGAAERQFLRRVNNEEATRVWVSITGGGYEGRSVDVVYSSVKPRHDDPATVTQLPDARFQLPRSHQPGFVGFLESSGFTLRRHVRDFHTVDMPGHEHTLHSSDAVKGLRRRYESSLDGSATQYVLVHVLPQRWRQACMFLVTRIVADVVTTQGGMRLMPSTPSPEQTTVRVRAVRVLRVLRMCKYARQATRPHRAYDIRTDVGTWQRTLGLAEVASCSR